MDAKKVLGVILILAGLFYALAPHELHVSSGVDFGAEHTVHITLGVVLIIIGLVLGYMSMKKKKGKK